MGWFTARLLPLSLLGLLGGMAVAQDGAAAAQAPSLAPVTVDGYTVTGRVLCGDTQRPARFAQVSLLPATRSGGGDDFGGRGRRLSARTDLEGNFMVANVPAGDYYVTGALTGYVNLSRDIQSALSAGTDPGTAAPGIPVVHVGAGGSIAALTLQRGGVVAGTVQWDDGSPASGVQVSAQLAPATGVSGDMKSQVAAMGGNRGPNFAVGSGSAQSDDRGRYRLMGLAPGVYLVRASLQVPVPIRGDERAFTRTFNLFVYAPNKMRRTDAAAVTIAGAEEHGEVGIVIGLAGLHSVAGVVSATGAAVHSGSVNLSDQTDPTLNRVGYIAADGSFTVADVPPGNYSLTVNASAQAPGSGSRGGASPGGAATVRFQPLQESIAVADGDLTGLTLNVTPASPATATSQ